jgi:hypothetical protein
VRAAIVAAAVLLEACAPTVVAPTPSPATVVMASAEPTATPATTPSPAEPTATPFVPCPSPQKVVADIGMAALCVPGANAFVETSGISHEGLRLLYDQIVADLAAVQSEFGWTLRRPPEIDVFATTATYRTGLIHVFGYSGATAAFVAENSVAFFEPDLRAILVNWEAVRDRRPIAAMRHELTHVVTLEACAPRCDLVPAWLNEGQARLAEATMPGGEWRLMRVRYEAASMAATNSLMPLSALVTQGQWNALTSWEGYYKYQEAAGATELLREDVGGSQPMSKLYERLRRGEDVAHAYASLTGEPFASFVERLASRFSEAVPSGPAIVTMAGPQADHGIGYLLYGFAPEEKVTLRIAGRRSNETEEITMSPQGAHFSEIPGLYPSGTYLITATSDGRVRATARTEKRGGRPFVG